jgi:LAGLIDADG endonuclease
VDSDNPGGAENQQERLIRIGWVVGFVDGEGCFSIGFLKQPDRAGRRGYTTGYQVTHRFAVTQAESSRGCLEDLQRFFGVGRLYLNRRHDNHREHLCQYRVERRDELLETIVPFFRAHPLRTAKQTDFERFCECMAIIAADRHRTREGLIEIAETTEQMNHQRSRQELIRILRGHTPDTLFSG